MVPIAHREFFVFCAQFWTAFPEGDLINCEVACIKGGDLSASKGDKGVATHIDPVCGMKVEDQKAAAQSTHRKNLLLLQRELQNQV